MTVNAPPTWQRMMAFALRAWLQQGVAAVCLAGLVGGGFGALVFLGSGSMDSLMNAPELPPINPGGLVTVFGATHEFLPSTSYLLMMAPALLGTLVAIVATLTLPGVVADDIGGGGIEVLLASPIARREVFSSYLGAALVVTAAAWIVAMVAFVVTGIAMSRSIGASLSLSPSFGLALFVIPLSMGVWSAAATLFGALLYPRSLESKAGMNGGPIRLIALLPSMVIIPSVLLVPDGVLVALGILLVVTLLASFGIVRITAHRFRSTRVLGS